MEIFMPSEIARLVLGYLKEENCIETMKCFLSECLHLTEYNRMLEMGREYPTNVRDVSLKMLVSEYGIIKYGTANNDSNSRGGSVFSTPSSRCELPCIDPNFVTPLVKLVNIAGNMERQLNNLVVINPSTNQGLAPHLLTFSGRHSSGQQSRRSRQKDLDSMNLIGREGDHVDEKDKIDDNNNNNNNDDDKKKKKASRISKSKERKNKIVISKKPNISESYVLLEKLDAGNQINDKNTNIDRDNHTANNNHNNKYNDDDDIINTDKIGSINKGFTKTNKTTGERKAVSRTSCRRTANKVKPNEGVVLPDLPTIPPESPVSALTNAIAPQKLPVENFTNSLQTIANNPLPTSNSGNFVAGENELTHLLMPSHVLMGSQPKVVAQQQDFPHNTNATNERVQVQVPTDMTMAEYFANFDSTKAPSEIEETTAMSETFGAPLHNSTSLVSLDDPVVPETPINFNQDETLVIQGSSPDVFESQTFRSSFSSDSKLGAFNFPSYHFKSLETSPIINKPTSVAATKSSSIDAPSPARSVKFRKLSQRFIAEHQKEQSLVQNAGKKVIPIRRSSSNNSNSISSTSELKRSEGARGRPNEFSTPRLDRGDEATEESEFSVRHIKEVVNFSDDDKTIETPYEKSDQEISSQIVSSSRLIVSPECYNSPLSCPSTTPLKRKIEEPSPRQPSPKKKKKDLKSMNIANFLARIHR